jgi:outer membrane protein
MSPEGAEKMTTRFYRQSRTALLSLFLLALPVAAQDQPAPAQTPQTPQQQAPLVTEPMDQYVSRPIPKRSAGLEPGKIKAWTLRDAILAALENNPDIELERSNVRQAQFDVISAQGAYDPVSTPGISYFSQNNPNTRPFSGVGSDVNTLTNRSLGFNYAQNGLIYRTGGSYSLFYNNSRNTSNNSLFASNYNPSMNFTITQPIWRNFKTDLNRNRIQINKKRLDLSDVTFRQRAILIISTVQTAYWDLALAHRNEGVAREAVKLAEAQLNNTKRQVEVGTVAPIDVVSTATQLESRRQDVFQAINAVAQAENALKALTVSGPNDDLWTAQIDTVEKFDVQPVNMTVDDAMRLAMDNRPELKGFALQKEINRLDIDQFKNLAKPQIDLTFGYTISGVGGNPLLQTQNTSSCGAGGLTLPTADGSSATCAQVFIPTRDAQNNITGYTFSPNPTFTPVVSTPRLVPTQISDTFVGGYGTGLKNMFSNDFRQWQLGVAIAIPWRNRTAKANLGRAKEESRRIELQTRRQMQDIEVEVRNAVQSVETARMRVDATGLARKYAQQQLDGEEKRFQAGLSSTFLILDRQTQFSQAQFAESSALADYNKAVATLQRVISTTLSSNSVEVKADPSVKLN